MGRTKKERKKMAYTISEKCTKCGSCVSVCPQEAISEGDPCYVIDPDKCVDCGLCADECPVQAIAAGA
jgi:ferredoxin